MMMRRSAWSRVRDVVHRHDRMLHDDMDLAVHLGDLQLAGQGRIAYRHDLIAGISARPLSLRNGPWLRTYRALHSFTVHGVDGRPWWRWLRADPAGVFRRLGLTHEVAAVDVVSGGGHLPVEVTGDSAEDPAGGAAGARENPSPADPRLLGCSGGVGVGASPGERCASLVGRRGDRVVDGSGVDGPCVGGPRVGGAPPVRPSASCRRRRRAVSTGRAMPATRAPVPPATRSPMVSS